MTSLHFEDPMVVNSGVDATEIIVISVVFAVFMVTTFYTLYGIVFRNWLRVRSYSVIATLGVLLSTINCNLSFFGNYIAESSSFANFQWGLYAVGPWAMCCFVISQLELFVLFAPILPFANLIVIRRCQLGAILIQAIVFIALFFQEPIVAKSSEIATAIVHNGVVAYGATASIFSIVQVAYLSYRIYLHHQRKRGVDFSAQDMVWFVISYGEIVVVDFASIYFAMIPSQFMGNKMIPSFGLQIKQFLIVYILMKLKSFTFARRRQGDTPKPQTLTQIVSIEKTELITPK
jgi:hypothetical protein